MDVIDAINEAEAQVELSRTQVSQFCKFGQRKNETMLKTVPQIYSSDSVGDRDPLMTCVVLFGSV